jgi:predicted MFS family arabinose efflux permease
MQSAPARATAQQAQLPTAVPPSLIPTMAVASGVAVANIYYNQPMLADIGRTFYADAHQLGLVATATQIGYAAGMPVFIPLGDFIERRSLVVFLFCAVSIALALAGISPNLGILVLASFLIGLTTVIAQILIPMAADLTPPAEAGKTIGTIMSGVLLGILLARTFSGFVSQHFGWRAMYWIAAAMALALALILRLRLPVMSAAPTETYWQMMRSILRLPASLPKLRQVAMVAGLFFLSFSAFWTTLVFFLAAPPYHHGSQAAGLFGLIGAVGAAVAPLAGRMSDRRSPRFVVSVAIVVVLAAFALFLGFGHHISGLVVGVILLDAGVQAAQVANQTRVLSLRADVRNRINTVYMICYFSGGSMGSLLGSYAWTKWHWNGVCGVGIGAMLLAAIALLARGPERP